MENFDLDKNTLDFQKQMMAVQEQTLKKAQAEMGYRGEDLKLRAAKAAVVVAIIALVSAGTTYYNNLENQLLKQRVYELEKRIAK